MFSAYLFKCQHEEYGTVFCKVIPKMSDDDDASVAEHYIRGEIEAGRKLNGRHVRKLLFTRDEAEMPEIHLGPATVLVFEWVDHTLEQVLSSGIPSPRQCLRLAFAIARALGEAHELSPPIHHRDVKKQNVLVEHPDDLLTAKLADFGISYMAGVQRITTMHTGSTLYMAPEQFDARNTITRQTDIYALALLVWEALTGTVPLAAKYERELRALRERGELGELRVGGQPCPELHKVFTWALLPNPGARPDSTMQLVDGIGTAGTADGLWTEEDVTDAREGTTKPRHVPRILVPNGVDERNSGGALELRLPHSAAPVLSRVTPDVEWTYSLRRQLWSTRSADVTITHVRRVLETLELRENERGASDRELQYPIAPQPPAPLLLRVAPSPRPSPPPPAPAQLRARFRASDALALIVGTEPMPKYSIAQRVWQYINAHALKAPDEDVIRLDETLRAVCGGRHEVSTQELTGFVARHIIDVP